MQDKDSSDGESSRSSRDSCCSCFSSRRSSVAGWFLGLWIAASLMTGSILMSLHVPFRGPGSDILKLAPVLHPGRPRMLHVLSGSCGCSQKIMRHLGNRQPWSGVDEQILVIDTSRAASGNTDTDHSEYLPGSLALLHTLASQGYAVDHLSADHLPPDTGLHGLPLLVFASAQGDILYLGGYGSANDQDDRLLRTGSPSTRMKAEPLFGCAVGASLQKRIDPFRLKYRLD